MICRRNAFKNRTLNRLSDAKQITTRLDAIYKRLRVSVLENFKFNEVEN